MTLDRWSALCLLLSSHLRFGGLLSVASNHDHTEERSYDGGAQENEDDGNTNSPDARRENILEGVVRIDKWLQYILAGNPCYERRSHPTIKSVHIV